VPLTPILGILICLYLIVGLPMFHNGHFTGWEGGLPFATFVRFVVWLVVGLVIYFSYGFRKSRLAQKT
jgi:basic amino acid/polyamine antiporter, APA family